MLTPRIGARVLACLLLFVAVPAARADDAPPRTLPLADCVAAAITANPGLASLANQRDAAAARATATATARLPTLDLVGAALHSTDPLRLRPARSGSDPGTFSRGQWQAGVALTMPVYTAGRLEAETLAARKLAAAAGSDTVFARQRLAVEIVSLYHEALAAEALLDALSRSRASLQAQMDRIEALIRQDKAAGVDQMRVAVRLARLDQDIADTRSRKAIVQATISVLMGRDPDAAWALDPAETLDPDSVATAPPAAPVPQARADEEAARLRLDAALEAENAARAERRPTVTAGLSWGPRGDFHGENYESGVAMLSFRVNLVDFGRARALLDEARYRRAAVADTVARVALDRSLEISAAEEALHSAETRVAVTRSVVEQALESLRIVQLRYELGDGTIVDVLDAQSASDEAAALRARALADLAIATAARDLAHGAVFRAAASTPALRDLPGLPLE